MGKTFRSFEELGEELHVSSTHNQALRQRAEEAKLKYLNRELRLSAEPRGRNEIDLRRGRRAVR